LLVVHRTLRVLSARIGDVARAGDEVRVTEWLEALSLAACRTQLLFVNSSGFETKLKPESGALLRR
jgi:hypothetical protein